MSGEIYKLYADAKRVLTALANELCDCGGKHNYSQPADIDRHSDTCPYVRAVLGERGE